MTLLPKVSIANAIAENGSDIRYPLPQPPRGTTSSSGMIALVVVNCHRRNYGEFGCSAFCSAFSTVVTSRATWTATGTSAFTATVRRTAFSIRTGLPGLLLAGPIVHSHVGTDAGQGDGDSSPIPRFPPVTSASLPVRSSGIVDISGLEPVASYHGGMLYFNPASQRPRKVASLLSLSDFGRYDLCLCGSGRRFKRCCLKSGRF